MKLAFVLFTLAILSAACTPQTPPGTPARSVQPPVDWLASGARRDTTAVGTDSLPRDFAHPPVLVRMPIIPLPVPQSVLGSKISVLFIIDARGAIERITFAGPPDRQYTQALLKSFRTYEFRPATRLDGSPVRGAFLFSYDFGR
jgi:hypothetical protein